MCINFLIHGLFPTTAYRIPRGRPSYREEPHDTRGTVSYRNHVVTCIVMLCWTWGCSSIFVSIVFFWFHKVPLSNLDRYCNCWIVWPKNNLVKFYTYRKFILSIIHHLNQKQHRFNRNQVMTTIFVHDDQCISARILVDNGTMVLSFGYAQAHMGLHGVLLLLSAILLYFLSGVLVDSGAGRRVMRLHIFFLSCSCLLWLYMSVLVNIPE